MPELPEVEVLARHLAPRLVGKRIRTVDVLDHRSIRPSSPATFTTALNHAHFQSVQRRGKYLVCTLRKHRGVYALLVHLGMTGRLYLARRLRERPQHGRVVLGLGRESLVFEDVRRFGKMTLGSEPISRLGPEPLESGFTVEVFSHPLSRSRQPIKVKLLDQSVVAGMGNIYACEALFVARTDPRTPSRNLDNRTLQRLRTAIQRVLSQAIRFGTAIPLDFGNSASTNGLFYYGQSMEQGGHYEERFRVYDREGEPCRRCGHRICKVIQAGRSTFFCPECQE